MRREFHDCDSSFWTFVPQLPPWFTSASYFATFIAYCNSAINPVIYGGFNKSFRDALFNIFKCECKREPFAPRRSGKQSSSRHHTPNPITLRSLCVTCRRTRPFAHVFRLRDHFHHLETNSTPSSCDTIVFPQAGRRVTSPSGPW